MLDSIKAWAQEHKKAIIFTCGVVVVGTTVFLIMKGKKVPVPAKEILDDVLARAPKAPSIPVPADTIEAVGDTLEKTFSRSEFIRRLPAGQHASPAKIAEAIEKGIELMPGETLVNETIVHYTYAA